MDDTEDSCLVKEELKQSKPKKHSMRSLLCDLGCAIVILVVLFVGFTSLWSGLPSEYGHIYVKRAISGYMIENNGRQPKSWEDIEPYDPYCGVDFGGYQTRKYWHVAWHVDFSEAFLSEMDRQGQAEPAARDRIVGIVYNPRRLPDDPIWVVREDVVRYFTDAKVKELRSAPEASAPEASTPR